MPHDSTYSVILTFGKHSGSALGLVADTDPQYLQWLLDNSTLSENWRAGISCALAGKSVADISLPRATSTVKPKKDSPITFTKAKATIELIDKKTASVEFGYNPALLAVFKREVDSRKWNDKKKWWEISVTQLPKAIRVLGGPKEIKISDKAKAVVVQEMTRRTDLDEIRVRETSDLKIATKIPLYGYQNVGVEFVERAGGRALIADEMGLGKTFQAIAYAVHKKHKTIIVCPASVKINWEREIKALTGKESCVWDSKGHTGHANNQFHIINYDSVQKQLSELRKIDFGLLVCDECTNIKNKKAIRTKAIMGDGRQKRKFPGLKTKDVIFLTGTPVLNRPSEIFTFLSFLAPDRFPNFMAFVTKYGGFRGQKPQNLQDLHERTKDVVIRRRLVDVKSELPEKIVSNVYIELTPEERRTYEKELKLLFRNWSSSSKATVSTMPAIQRVLHTFRRPKVIETLDALLEAGRSIVVFSTILDPLFDLHEHYKDISGLLHGSMSLEDRQVTIDGIASGKLRIAFISLKAGGMGVNGLQHGADNVIFLDQDWVPANHSQAEARVHRNGQKNSVHVYYMLCADTIDEDQRDLSVEKQAVADQIVDGRLVTAPRKESLFRQFVKRITKKYYDEAVAKSWNIED